jgi:hypothetical protein
MNIRLFAWWTNSHTITDVVKRQYIGSHFIDPDVTLVTDDNYDYAIVFGYTNEQLKTDKEHTIYFLCEPTWSKNWDREAHKKSSRVFCPSKQAYGNYDECIEHRDYIFIGGHGDAFFDVDTILNYSKIEKHKNLSFVVTYRSVSPLDGTNNGNIYDKRVRLAENLLNGDKNLDIYGFLWEYSPYNSEKLKKHIYTKFLALDDYKFSIAIENCTEKNYITEKFYDCLLFNTVPIYFGAPNINEYPELAQASIILDNLDNYDYILNIIDSLSEELYQEKMKNILNLKVNLFNSPDFNVWKKILLEIKK